MHPTSMHNDTDEGDEVRENSGNDEFEESDDMLQEDNMQVAAQDLEDDTDQVKNVQANNEYVELIDLHPDEFDNTNRINLTCVERISSEFNRLTHIATNGLKMGDTFQSKVELLQAISKLSIPCGVSFVLVKTNRTCYIAVCASIVEGDNICKDVYL